MTAPKNMLVALVAGLALVGLASTAVADPITTACKNGPSTATCFRPMLVVDTPNGAKLPPLFAEVLNVGGVITFSIQANLDDVPDQFISDVVFNLDPSITPSALTFTLDAVQSTQTEVTIVKGAQNAQSLPPISGFDLQFQFPTAGSDGGSHRFKGNELVEWTVTCNSDAATGGDPDCASFGVNSFDFFNSPTGGFRICAHVQGVGTAVGGSDKVCGAAAGAEVPEPAITIMLVSSGLTTLIAVGSCRRRK